MASSMRITGMATGMDTDKAVKDMTKSEQSRVDKVKKDRQLATWRMEHYRGVSDKLSTFTNTYFNTLTPTTNFKSSSAFAKFSYDMTVNGTATTKVSISANGDIKNFNQEIAEISQLATKDTWEGAESSFKGITSAGFDLANLKTKLGTDDLKMNVTIGSSTKTITVANADVQAMASVDNLVSALNGKISATTAFGADYSNIVSKVSVNGVDELKFDMKANTVKLTEFTGNASTFTGLKITSGSSNMDYASKTISTLMDLTGIDVTKLSINGVSNFGITNSDTVTTMMTKINASTANVKMSFNMLTNKFVLESTKEGSANNITMSGADTTGLFAKLGITDVPAVHKAGQNAKLKLNGADIVMSSNTFTIEGLTVTLKDTFTGSASPIKVGIKKDTTAILDNVVKFVNEYNKIVEEINTKINEKTYRDFKPLTDEQKKDMTEDQIKVWETKAKSGLLRNESDLSNMLSRMRTAIYESVDGVGLSMADIGITTTADYKSGGKLTIDENKLRNGIENRYEDVVKLFTNESDKAYMSSGNSTERYKENGIANRINDIFQDAVRVTRDTSNKKGFLLEKAGKLGDASQGTNILQKQINDYDTKIDSLLKILADREEKYYQKFAKLESTMSKLQSQQSSMNSQLGR